ncbi:DUF4278 domain-containing protein [Acaryochloris marina NIES-2412]|uniref:DUF4278 domain-containing protein n=1 Tax=Acaryochloris marina TaxID=155978 RepID=UPI004057DF7D
MPLKYRNTLYTAFINTEANTPEGYTGRYRGLSTTIPTAQPTATPQKEQVIKYRGVTTTLHIA